MGGPRIDVDDVVQEVFLVAHRRWDTYDERRAHVSTWLYAITLNVVRHARRRQRVSTLLPFRLKRSALFEGAARSPAEEFESREISDRIAAVLDRLSPSQREAFVLSEVEGMSGAEITALTGRNPTTMRVHLHRARAAFASALRAYDPDLAGKLGRSGDRSDESDEGLCRQAARALAPPAALGPATLERIAARIHQGASRTAAPWALGLSGVVLVLGALVVVIGERPPGDAAKKDPPAMGPGSSLRSGVPTPTSTPTGGVRSQAALLEGRPQEATIERATGPSDPAAHPGSETAVRESAAGVMPPDCPAYAPGPALHLCSRRRLGGHPTDEVKAVALAEDGSLIMAGALRDPPGDVAVADLGAGPGVVVRLTADGRTVLGAARVEGEVRDLAVHGSGAVVLATSVGVQALNVGLTAVEWRVPLPGGTKRLDVGEDGSIAVLETRQGVSVLSAEGEPLGQISLSEEVVSDVVLSSGSVVVTGSNRRALCGRRTETAFVAAFDLDGSPRWRAYDRQRPAASWPCWGTRGARLVRGPAGQIVFAGLSFGNESQFLRDPLDPTRGITVYDAPQPARAESRTTAAPSSFIARLDAQTGALEAAQFLSVRTYGQQRSSVRVTDLAVDAKGGVILVGMAGCCFPGREHFRLNDAPIERYALQDSFVAVLPPSLEGRTTLLSFGSHLLGALEHVAVSRGMVVMAGGPWRLPKNPPPFNLPSPHGVHVATWRGP